MSCGMRRSEGEERGPHPQHIKYTKSDFKITLKRKQYQADLAKMEAWKFRKILGALSSSQRLLAKRLRSK